MAKELSPKKYIETNARKLPIYKCLVNKDWESANMANIIIMRKHINGNVTVGVYLVDLTCLGIKDTFFFFNESVSKVEDKLDAKGGFFKEIDYNLAHNIVFAGHDYALDYTINPHPDFSFTKFILEEDNDEIPLIDIKVGGPNGKPHLILQPGQASKYKHIYDRLMKNLGKDNFYYTIEVSGFNDIDDEDDEDDEMDSIDDFPMGSITMYNAQNIDIDDIMNLEKVETRLPNEILNLDLEFVLRTLQIKRKDLFYSEEELEKRLEYALYQESEEYPSWMSDKYRKECNEMILRDIGNYHNLEKVTDSEEILAQFDIDRVTENVDKYQHNPFIMSLLYEKALIQENEDALKKLKPIIKRLAFQNVSHKLLLALGTYYLNEPDPSITYIIDGSNIQKLFPIVNQFSETELNLFAMLKLLVNTRNGNIKEAIYYYQFISLVLQENPLITALQFEFETLLEDDLREAHSEILKEIEDNQG